jgi:hypothetical protein
MNIKESFYFILSSLPFCIKNPPPRNTDHTSLLNLLDIIGREHTSLPIELPVPPVAVFTDDEDDVTCLEAKIAILHRIEVEDGFTLRPLRLGSRDRRTCREG